MSEKLEFVILAKDQFTGAFGKLKSHLPSIKQLALGASAGVTALSASIYAITKSTAESYDKVQKFSDQLGISTEFISKMGMAAEFSGVQSNTMSKAIQMLQVRIGEAAQGIGEGKDAFINLGISLRDANGQLKTAEQIMPELADAFHNTASATERAEMASAIFGQRGMSMLQVFKNGSAGLNEMTAEAEKFGLVISAKAGANAAAFNDSLTRVKGSLTGVKNKLAEELMPTFTGVFNRLADYLANNREMIVGWASKFIEVVGSMAEKGAYGVAVIIDAWRGLEMIWNTLKIALGSFAEYFLETINSFAEKWKSLWEHLNFRGVFDEGIADIQKFIDTNQGAIDSISSFSTAAKADLDALINQGMAIDKVTAFGEAVRNTLSEIRAEGNAGAGLEEPTGIYPLDNANLEQVALNQEEMRLALENLALMHDEYMLTEEEKLTAWYEKQKEMFKGNKDAMARLDDIYTKKKKTIDDKNRKDTIASEQNLYSSLETIGSAFGKRGVLIAKMAAIPQAIMSMWTGASKALELPFPANLAAAAGVIATGMGFVSGIRGASYGMAHGGLDYVPREQTYLLDKGERVLSPNQNADLKEFMKGGGGNVTVAEMHFHVLENATNVDAMLQMDADDWAYIVEDRVMPALSALKKEGKTV